MIDLFQITNLPAAEKLLMSIPESAEVLVFGVALTAAAVGIRLLLARWDHEKRGVEVTGNLR